MGATARSPCWPLPSKRQSTSLPTRPRFWWTTAGSVLAVTEHEGYKKCPKPWKSRPSLPTRRRQRLAKRQTRCRTVPGRMPERRRRLFPLPKISASHSPGRTRCGRVARRLFFVLASRDGRDSATRDQPLRPAGMTLRRSSGIARSNFGRTNTSAISESTAREREQVHFFGAQQCPLRHAVNLERRAYQS
jgi:hypothetical protein